MFLRLAPATVALFAALLLAACDSNGDNPGGQPQAQVKAVTTLAVFEDMVGEIGGDRVEVSSLLPSGADPHTYEPVPRDVRLVTEADVLFVNGLGLEEGILKVIEPNLPSDVPMIELAEEAAEAGVPLREFTDGEQHEEAQQVHEGADPHVWLSVDNAREYARIILDALSECDPEGAARYAGNHQSYLARLDELDEYVADKVSGVPPEQRNIVSTHHAFGYLADYMGFEVAGVVAISPGQEPSASDVADLQEKIEEAGVAAVFEEPQLGAEGSVLRQTAADLGIEVCTLYSGALDERVPTYIDLMRFNVDELARCLIE
jgi:ABC-type Zn uptake system ZnuABC Zn-binding protein ZnuA